MIRRGVRRPRIAALVALACAGSAFTVVGAWIPLKAEIAQRLLDRAWAATAASATSTASSAATSTATSNATAASASTPTSTPTSTATEGDGRNARPWPWADTWPIARLHLPGIDDPLIVLAGASSRNLAFGPVHVEGTAPPGAEGVSVIAGHRDTHFRVLQHLQIGDHIEVEAPGSVFRSYRIAAIDVVDAERGAIRLDADGSAILLVTCYPFDAAVPGGPLRYVVTARDDYPLAGTAR